MLAASRSKELPVAFQDEAERLATKLHLSAVPRPVFVGVALLLCIALGAALWMASSAGMRDDFEIQAAQEPAGALQPAEGDGTDADPSAEEPAAADVALPAAPVQAASLCVHVDGAVQAPGVYHLAAGSRIMDAVDAAGGLAEGALTAAVNLAQPVQDGEQIVIPRQEDGSPSLADAGTAAPSEPTGPAERVNINRASAAELTALNGVGEATAAKIVADREQNGPFRTVEDLKRVSGIGDKKFEALKDSICV